MSVIGKNIKKIRVVKKISQNEFSNLFKVSRASVGSYEEGRAEPRIDTIINMANYFGLSIDTLLTKELTYDELYQLNIFKHDASADEMTQLALTDKDHRKEDTPLVIKENYLEYIVNYDHKDYINNLPYVRLPNTQYEKTRAFEVQDNAMEFGGHGLLHGDILSCSPVTKEELKAGEVYVLVTDQNIFVRRLMQQQPTLEFRPDNPNYIRLDWSKHNFHEIWKVEGFYSTILEPPSLQEERIALLEKKVGELERLIRR